MKKYLNLTGNSGVDAYETGLDYIKVRFKDYSEYLYTYSSTGVADVEEMKSLAQRGQGLNSYISRIVRKRYAAKLR